MAQFIPYECPHCARATRHDVLSKVNGTQNVVLRLSCSKCANPSFTIEVNREIAEASIVYDPPHYSIEDDPGDLTNFH